MPYLQGLLNEDILEKKESLKSLFNHGKDERIKKRAESNNTRVNYICNVDVIT